VVADRADPAVSGYGPGRRALTGIEPAGERGRGPVIALAYPGSGAGDLHRLLDRSQDLCCTSGTGLLPLCEVAAATWRRVDRRYDDALAPLALASVRALTSVLISAAQATLGGSRWCEVAFSSPEGADVFLQLYPATRVVCLHRNCAEVIRAGVLAYPWGIAGTAFAAFAPAFPASPAAAIAAFWASRTEQLLRFEDAHPSGCLRVRQEDLASEPDQAAAAIAGFLDLDLPPAELLADGGEAAADHLGKLDADQLPPPLRARVNELQHLLGYPPIA
jgi:Sulfotransferase family